MSPATSYISRAAQVGRCTPLVTDPIGTSSGSKPGYSGANMFRDTWPCSLATPFARCASRRPMCAMLNRLGSSSEPSAMTSSTTRPGSSRDIPSPSGVQVVPDQVDREPVDTGRHRGVRGEHRAGPHRGQRLGEGQPVVGDQRADPFQAEESGVALVHVEDLGQRVPGRLGVGLHRADAADAEQDLLLDPVVLVAAVQLVGGPPQEVVVGLVVGVQQQQRHPADLGTPDPRGQQPAARHRHADGELLAVGAEHPVDRQTLRIVRRVVLLLPAVRGQRLPEVAEPVQQADPDDRHAQIGRRLQVVAGQDAKTARVVRQHLGDAELHGEVGDGLRQGCRPDG